MSTPDRPEDATRIVAMRPAVPPEPRHFVGRGEEIMRLAHTFERGPGAILWGAGGIGKSTLALNAAYRQAWRFPDGMLWFPLTGGRVGFRDLLTSHLGVSATTASEQLLYLLAHGRVLLLLDSFEDAPDQEFALQLLAGLPANGCRVLITTRHLVTLKGWELIELPELPLADALLLFCELVQGRQFDQSDAGEAAAICTLLGGHPLALELAAAQMRDYRSVGDLLAALEHERGRLLQDPSLVAVHEKDRNVYYSFALSFEHLTEAARNALARLAVFFTPWSERGALAVTGLAEEAWFPVRDELRAKSFLRRDSDRYWLHPLIRDFALGHLSDVLGGHRLAATYLQAQASSAGITPDEGLALPTHWLEAADWDQAARAALLLEEELSRQGYWEPIAARLSAALGAVPATEQTAALRGHLYLALGKRLYYLARWERALDSYQQALDLYRAVGARLGEANTLLATGTLWLEQDQPEKALKTFDDALRLYSQVGDRVGQTNVYWTVGQWHAARGDVEEAIPLLEQAVAFVQEIRHPCAASWDAYLQSVRRQTEKEA